MTAEAALDDVLLAPRFSLGVLPTPLVPAPRLAEQVGARALLLVKRDDLAGFVTAGSKVRPLELLLGHAVEQGYDTLVTAGVAGSSFCQAAATAAHIAGLRCQLLLPGERTDEVPANLAMALACGAEVSFTGQPRERLDDLVRERAARLTRSGRRAMGVPRGGADEVGALGFVLGAAELADQLSAAGVDEARIVIAVGSGGSVSGLLVGRSRLHLDWAVTGVSVSRPLPGLDDHLAALVTRCAQRVGVDDPGTSALTLVASRGRAHGPADSEELECAALALATEGLLLDDAYTARSGLVATQLSRTPGPPVVLWHTGGLVRAVTDYDHGARNEETR
jgi:1-aminocyclopropane-1-carboxylate deaminase/D-cysteine desulfhydrase-like pyridoxal-dependent ACC family enzyme